MGSDTVRPETVRSDTMRSDQSLDNDDATTLAPTPNVNENDKYQWDVEATTTDKPWDPTKLSWPRKIHIIIAGFTCTFNCNLGSSMPSGALDAISEHFGVTNQVQLILLNSLYMAGYVLGPLLFGPLSEYIGRRPVLIGTFLGYLVFMLACSVAPTYSALLVFRLFCGINAAAPTTVISALYADILDNPSHRGSAIAFYMCITNIGPLTGPLISGYASQASWRWPFWAAALVAVPGLPFVVTLPETFAPVLHAKYVKKSMKNGGGDDLLNQLQPFNVRKIFLRPMTLLFTEPILLSTSLYLALAYSIQYLMFQAYPKLFQDQYGLAPGPAGLAYIPMSIGCIVALIGFYIYNWWFDTLLRAGSDWAKKEINRRLPLACVAAPCMVISLFWLGWTSWEDWAPIVPSIGGFFFGFGYMFLFIGMGNYLTDVFRQASASAQAAASCTRSLMAVLLPLAADSMYSNLGLHWAPSVLGFISVAMGVIPFIFMRYGDELAKRSKYAQPTSRVTEAAIKK